MSNAVFPTLPGLTFNVVRTPMFSTMTQRALSGREIRGTYQNFPLYQFDLAFEFLRDMAATPELDTLIGFYLARQGSFDSFRFNDLSDNSVTDMQFGVGDGITPGFQLTRAFGAGGFTFPEPIQNVNVLTNIKKAGVIQTNPTNYTIDGNGFVTFAGPPAALASLTWTGTYFFRCRFLDDQMGFNNFMQNLWEAQQVQFIGAPGNRV